jgi:RND superfamily putative drug exporter
VHDPSHPGGEARPRPRTVGRTAPPAPQEPPFGRRHRADARPDHAGGGGRRGGADDPFRGGPQRRQERGEQRCGGRGPAPHRVRPPQPDREIESWLGELRGKPAAAPGTPEPAADDATTAIPTQAEPVAEDETATISAEETRAIPVSRPEPADNEVATEKLNARGKNAGDDRRRGGGVSAQDLLRREGRL